MRRVALAIVSTVAGLVMLLSFKTQSSATKPPAVIGSANPGADTASSPSSSPSSSFPSSSASSSSSSSSGTKTVTGDSVNTRWGPVQVQITVTSGKISKVSVVDYLNGNSRDQEINSYAIPQLVQETLSAQSAKIDTISGATVTSDG